MGTHYTIRRKRLRELDPEKYRAKDRARCANNRTAILDKNKRSYLKTGNYLYKTYGITQGEKDELLESQGGGCAICGEFDPGSAKGWHLNHDHDEGTIRGVLCHHCNLTLGNAKDSPNRLRLAAEYLEKHIMAMTPERKVKNKIEAVFQEHDVYWFAPVQNGMGAAGLDYHCSVSWRKLEIAFWVEAKAEAGKKPTPRQIGLIKRLRARRAKVFIIGSVVGVEQLRVWLDAIKRSSERDRVPAG